MSLYTDIKSKTTISALTTIDNIYNVSVYTTTDDTYSALFIDNVY